MNTALLKSHMTRSGDTQAVLANALGISLSCANAKINGKTDFWSSEIGHLKMRYCLSAMDVDSIFFDAKVSKKDTLGTEDGESHEN